MHLRLCCPGREVLSNTAPRIDSQSASPIARSGAESYLMSTSVACDARSPSNMRDGDGSTWYRAQSSCRHRRAGGGGVDQLAVAAAHTAACSCLSTGTATSVSDTSGAIARDAQCGVAPLLPGTYPQARGPWDKLPWDDQNKRNVSVGHWRLTARSNAVACAPSASCAVWFMCLNTQHRLA